MGTDAEADVSATQPDQLRDAQPGLSREREQGVVTSAGPGCPDRRIGIISFNLKDHRGRYLHPKFVTSLLNDLFGIQFLYNFDLHSGAWTHKFDEVDLEGFSLEAALECGGYHKRMLSDQERKYMYSAFLGEAKTLAGQLASEGLPSEHCMDPELESLKFFSVPESSVVNQ